MIGLSKEQRKFINLTIGNLFDDLAYQFIGDIPSLKGKKNIFFSTKEPLHTLARLFIQSNGNKPMNAVEKTVLNNKLDTALEYIDKLKLRTQTDTAIRLDGFLKTKAVKGQKVTKEELNIILSSEMDKAGKHIKTIANAEATSARNVGKGLEIIKVASGHSVEDPVVFFIVIKDNVTCKECLRLHLMPDKITPRLWKFSELNHGYHKKGNLTPSINGAHPHCRCTLTYMAPGFGFGAKGKVKYVKGKFDALKFQRGIV